MTKQDFVDTVTFKNRFKIGTEIALAISISLTGLVLNYSLYTTAWLNHSTDRIRLLSTLMYGIGVALFVFGLLVLYKIWRDYQIEVLVTKLDIKKNRLLVDRVASCLRWATIQKGEIREYLSCSNSWPHCSYEIRVLADNGKIYVDVQSIQSRLLDFGDRSRLTTSIKDQFAVGLCTDDYTGHSMPEMIRVDAAVDNKV